MEKPMAGLSGRTGTSNGEKAAKETWKGRQGKQKTRRSSFAR
jgi:hypothetical protein